MSYSRFGLTEKVDNGRVCHGMAAGTTGHLQNFEVQSLPHASHEISVCHLRLFCNLSAQVLLRRKQYCPKNTTSIRPPVRVFRFYLPWAIFFTQLPLLFRRRSFWTRFLENIPPESFLKKNNLEVHGTRTDYEVAETSLPPSPAFQSVFASFRPPFCLSIFAKSEQVEACWPIPTGRLQPGRPRGGGCPGRSATATSTKCDEPR